MSKTQLLEEANRAGVIVHHAWGVKAADPTEQMKRVSHMSLPELRAKASELKIDYANTITKGNLLRLIRDSLNTPDQELMKIGKDKGYQFCEIPKELWRVGSPRTSPSGQPRSGTCAVREVQSEVINDPIVLLELGGFEATLEATEIGKAVLEPLSWEDYLDPGVKDKTLHRRKAVTPRHLHIHFGGAPGEAYDDLKTLVREQLEGGGAVVLQGGQPELVVNNLQHYQRYSNNHEGEDWIVLARPGSDKCLEIPGNLNPRQVLVVNDDKDRHEERPLRIDGSGIVFEEGVPGHVRSALKRLRQNLGHPRTPDLVRHLRLSGCEPAVLKAAKGMKCQVCDSTKDPQVARPASMPRMLTFGEIVAADILYAHDCNDNRHVFLSLVDVGTTYHIVIKLRNTSGKEVKQAFNTYWVTPFGAPNAVSLDLETGLQDAFQGYAVGIT